MSASGDAGVPLVIGEPQSLISGLYRDIARLVAARLSVESYNAMIPLGVPIMLDNSGNGGGSAADTSQGHRPLRLG